MAEQVLKPDLDFVKGVIAAGGDSLKKCYQCATCSVVCNVTPDEKPFPRKEMIWAQWGLKEKFQGNPDVWLCHQCNDCTVYCPRGAKPGEVLGAIRKQSIQQYASPGALSCIVNSKKFMPLLFLAPAILFFIVLSIWGTLHVPEGDVVFSNLFPIFSIQAMFIPALAFGVIIGALGVKKFWADMKQAAGVTTGDLKGSIIETAKEFLGHQKFKLCDVSKDRFTSHFLVFYSFVSLAIATTFGVLYIDIFHIESPFELFGKGWPVKLFGLIGAVGLFVGVLLMMSNRMKNAEKVGIGSYFDWMLLTVIGVVMLSGILAWLTRLAGAAAIAYPIYFIHLVFVFSLFIYLPYSKLAHMFYRSAALCFLKYSGREAQAAQPSPAVAAPQQETETGQQ
jgi:quinone-modifying oxidoreductase subunit QmoC